MKLRGRATLSRRRKSFRVKALRNWTLRAQILAGVLTLFIALSLTIGLFTELALKRSLTDRLDNELTRAGSRFQQAAGFRGFTPLNGVPASDPRSTFDLLPPPASLNQIGARFSSASAQGAIQREFVPSKNTASALAESRSPLNEADLVALAKVSADGKPRTIDVPGLGSYRVLARTSADSVDASEGEAATYVSGLPMKGVNDTVTKLIWVILGLTATGLIIAVPLCALLVRLALRPLHRVTSTASRVAEMALDEGEVALAVRVHHPNPHTEVGQVGVALNRMLENVSDALVARHRSETQVRQFVADASHELRTPLASIRGYAELTRRSQQTVPPDIAHAMGRVESEARRMTTLVEDLLLLARLDAGKSLDTVELDLTSLTIDVLSDAHIASPEHRWHLAVPDEPVMALGDPARLHQVLANLLANASTHTPPGTNVFVSLEVQPLATLIKVRDDGPGIAPTVIDHIFERFARGEESRSRTAGSTGLGLAIVSAVVTASGGTISVTSRPGETVFTVVLPSHARHQGDPQIPASLAPQTSAL